MPGDLLYTCNFQVVYTQSSVLLQDTVENENYEPDGGRTTHRRWEDYTQVGRATLWNLTDPHFAG